MSHVTLHTSTLTHHTSHHNICRAGRVDDGEGLISAGVRAAVPNINTAFEFQRQVRETLEEAGVHVCPAPYPSLAFAI
jgi:hypothetical protein